MGYFDKTSGIRTLKGKFAYIQNHFTYWTLNSWNGLQSIANNVKLYHMGLTNTQIDKLWALEDANNYEYWDQINLNLRWLQDDYNIEVGFNGRSSGYLVLYPDKGASCAVHSEYWDYDNVQDWIKDYASGYDYRAAQHDIRSMVEDDFELVQKFDRLCDEMRESMIYMAENTELEEEIYTVTKTVQHLVFA